MSATDVTVLIASYHRSEYLRFHLRSLMSQDFGSLDVEVVVINDGVADETEMVADDYGAKYLFTGQRNQDAPAWRVPGFAFNIGIRRSHAKVVVLTCAEMYHVGRTLVPVVTPAYDQDNQLGTPAVLIDDEGPVIDALKMYGWNPYRAIREARFRTMRRFHAQDPFLANPFMPYFLAVNRQRLIDIGGYDEDFTGIGADDNDLTDRLRASGCRYDFAPAEVVHLHHPKHENLQDDPRYQHNVKLWRGRKGQVVRNKGREWGSLK